MGHVVYSSSYMYLVLSLYRTEAKLFQLPLPSLCSWLPLVVGQKHRWGPARAYVEQVLLQMYNKNNALCTIYRCTKGLMISEGYCTPCTWQKPTHLFSCDIITDHLSRWLTGSTLVYWATVQNGWQGLGSNPGQAGRTEFPVCMLWY